MKSGYSYACCDYPEMESCPGKFVAETKDELWQVMEVHARLAHGEDPSDWSNEDRAFIEGLIKTEG